MNLEYKLFAAGYCKHPEFITIKGGSWCSQKYPAICTLIKHPKFGNILFDTGYTSHFFKETQKWPFWLYKKIIPVSITKQNTISEQLKKINISKIDYIIVSHFHADHIAGLRDFKDAKIICSKIEYNLLKEKKGFMALKKGFLANLLPDDFLKRVEFIEEKKSASLDKNMHPFTQGWDVFGDGSIKAINLSGHSIGQIGLLFNSQENKSIFLVADSCWSSKAYREYKLPANITYLIHDNKTNYQNVLAKLNSLYKNNKNIKIVPSHCSEIWQEIMEKQDV